MSVDDVVDAYSYWTFSDIFKENYFPSIPFHGGFGLINLHGIAKPIYRAFQFLLALGDRQYPTVGRHESVALRVGKKMDDSRAPTNLLLNNQAMPRHVINHESIKVRLFIADGLNPRGTRISRIDEDNCNPARVWHAMGQPKYLTTVAIKKLRNASEPIPTTLSFSREQGEIVFDFTLPPQSLAFVSIEWEP